ncbi:CcgAII protein (plasmid) [Xanthomonas oryzae pv. oryzae]|uniref:CcgAII protein n=1 Tax=Xanthomonas oryzae TaxID=347 RepID=UPI00217DB189|nr:CcgAII protein [Xanthomonas oryzae]UWI58937.1 CcgAII protein [Xanthomonas oryzae pv. oryzae]
MTTEFNPDQCRAYIATLADKANDGCGLIYELYQRRLSGRIDGYVATLPAEHQQRAIELARNEFDYLTADEIAYQIERDHDEGYCSHGIDRNYCPAGCGDLED